jgi:TIR domain
MSKGGNDEFARVLRVFISSSTSEMELYRSRAIQAVHDVGMHHTNYNDPGGAGISHRNKTIFEMNRDTIHQVDVFVGLYGFGGVWRPASHPGLTEAHPELLDDPDKLIMEYEYEWAREAGVLMFPFVCTDKTTGVQMGNLDDRMYNFRLKIMARNVAWLTTPDAFYDQIKSKLQATSPSVFLSYSRKDDLYVTELQKRLRDEDIFTWRDKTSIGGSVEWARALEAALQSLDALVVVVTPGSAQSEWVEKECKEFLRLRKRVYPYIADPASKDKLPEYLKNLQYIDGTEGGGFNELTGQLLSFLDAAR